MANNRVISNVINVNTLEDGEVYYVEWTDANGVITNIPCDENGYAKNAYSSNEWIRATLYKREGANLSTPVQCYEIYLKAYLEDGTEYTGSGWPKTSNLTSYIALDGYEGSATNRVKYVSSFYDVNHNLLCNYSIVRTFDGASAPQYTREYYAWSNQASTSGIGVEPSPNSGWQDNIASQGSYAYLWKKIVLYTYDSFAKEYIANSPQYYRMNGENGTSISIKGKMLVIVKGIYSYIQDLPTSGVSQDEYAFVKYDQYNRHLWKYEISGSTGSWVEVSHTFTSDDMFAEETSNIIHKYIGSSVTNFATASDGDAYTLDVDGNLRQWSNEASVWLDLGQFKGESGTTYYTHIAWANTVTFLSTPLEPAQGCLNKRNAASVSGGTIVPPTSSSASKPYMGIRIDTIAGTDSEAYDTYTWELVKGAQGDRGKTGKFYYFAGVWSDFSQTATFKVSDAQTPYFKYTDNHYWVFIGEVSEGYYTKSQLGTPSSQNANWKLMVDDFKYIITEAIFGSFAHFGGFIMNDPWMISQYASSDSPSSDFRDFDGDPINGQFRPAYAVNGQNGSSYLQSAYIKGQVNATSGKIAGFDIQGKDFHIGDDTNWNQQIPSTGDITLLSDGRIRLRSAEGSGENVNYTELALGAHSDNSDSKNALVIRRKYNNLNVDYDPAVKISHFGSGIKKVAITTQQGVNIFSEGAVEYNTFVNHASSTVYFSVIDGTTLVLKHTLGAFQTCTFYLPAMSEFVSSYAGTEDMSFCVEYTLVANKSNNGACKVCLRDGGTYFVDNNGDNWKTASEGVKLSKGEVLKLLLVFTYENDSYSMYAQRLVYNQ